MSKVFTGSKGSLKINGVKVGFVGNINVTQEDTLTPINVLDQLQVAENAETAHIVSFSCNVFKIDGNSLADLGIHSTSLDDVLVQPELTMEVYNREADRVEYTMSGVKFEGGSGTLDARGVWNGTWNFRGVQGSGL